MKGPSIDRIDLDNTPPDPAALRRVTLTAALAYRVVPVSLDAGELCLATATDDFSAHLALDDIRLLTGLKTRGVLASAHSIDRILTDWARREQSGESSSM